jgi:hypothetical protein
VGIQDEFFCFSHGLKPVGIQDEFFCFCHELKPWEFKMSFLCCHELKPVGSQVEFFGLKKALINQDLFFIFPELKLRVIQLQPV